MKELESREYESDSHKYEVTHWGPAQVRRHERVHLRVIRKKDQTSSMVSIPVDDAAVVGDLVAGMYLESAGYERKDVLPDELRENDVIEGLGPILEIEEIPGMTFDMLKVMVQTIPKPDGDGVTRGTASVLFSQENGAWPSLVGITRPVEIGTNESP